MAQPGQQKKLKTFGPVEKLDKSGFLCIRQGGDVYPPFYDLDVVNALRNNWDTAPNDIFVTTHQKVGTHLTKKYTVEILRAMFHYPKEHLLGDGDIGHDAVPWPEVLASQHGIEAFFEFLEKTKDLPRVWYLHAHSNSLPFRSVHSQSKFMYTFRDPRGAAVSQYFFYKGHPNLEVDPTLSMNDFVSLFTKGILYFGDYHQHVLDWLNGCHGQIAKHQLLALRYEDLVLDKTASATAIASFIKPEYIQYPGIIGAICKSTEFDTMKQGLIEKPGSFHFNPHTFFRAGTTDDWQQHLSPENQEIINQKTLACWGGNDLTCPPVYIHSKTLQHG